MPTPTFDHDLRDDLVVGRYRAWTLSLYAVTATGYEPLEIAADDNVRAKLWYTDAESPDIDAEATTPADSYVEIVDLGDAGVTPAQVTIHWHQDDTAALVADRLYKWELLLIDHSDGDKAKTIAMGQVRVRGAATGSLTA